MMITYNELLKMYCLQIKGFDFNPHYATRSLAIAHGLKLIAYYKTINI